MQNPIQLLIIKQYAKYFSVNRNTARHFYYTDLTFLRKKFKGKTAMHVHGYITNYGFAAIYGLDAAQQFFLNENTMHHAQNCTPL